MKNFKKIAGVAVFAFAFAFAGAAFASVDVPPSLKVGSMGQEVMDLQAALGGLTVDGNFGAMTKAAVVAYQSAHGLTADGIVGPMTASSINGGTTGTGTGTATGALCPNGMTLASNCTSGATAGGTLEGGAGSVDNYDLMGNYSSEEVGEGEEDVIVQGFEVDADTGSDLDFTSFKLSFENSDTGSSEDLDDYATEVAIMLDGEEVGRADVDDFSSDDDDNDNRDEWTKSISLDNAVIDAGETMEFTIAITSASNIDSADYDSDSWSVDVTNARFTDAEGTSISEDPSLAENEFQFEDFAGAADLEVSFELSDDSPDAQVVNVDDNDDTDGVELMKFTIEADGSDITINDLPIRLVASGAGVATIANNLVLEVDGEEFNESLTASNAGSTTATITFDNIDFTIDDGDTVEFTLSADVNDHDGTFGAGDTLKAEVTSAIRNAADIEDEQGDTVTMSNDSTGTALGDEMSFYDVGIMVTLEDTGESVVSGGTNAYDDTGTFTISYRVEAFDGTVYVSDGAAATTDVGEVGVEETQLPSAGGVVYVLERGGTATVADVSSFVTFSTAGGASDSGVTNGVELTDGEYAVFTLTVTRTNNNSGDAGLFRVLLDAIAWSTTDATPMTGVYDFDLEDFKTDIVSVN